MQRGLAVHFAVLVSTFLMSVGCGAPASSLDHVQAIERLPLRSAVVFDQAADRGRYPIFEIAVADETLRLATPYGVLWITPDGRVARQIDFTPTGRFLTPVRSLRDGDGLSYAGFDARSRKLLFFDGEGREVASDPCRDCWDLLAADVDGAGRDTLVVRSFDGKAAKLFGARGTKGDSRSSPGFLTDVAAGRIAGEPASSVFFYLAPDNEYERAVRVFTGDGRERARWPIAKVRAIVPSSAADGTSSVLSIDANTNALVEHEALTGKTISRTVLEGSAAFSGLFTSRWPDGKRVVVLSGGGYLNKHMVAVIDAAGAVVYRTIGEGRAYAFAAPSAQAPMFYVAIDGQVKRYSMK